MKCVDASEVLRLIAGQLSVEQTELLDVHFKHCTKCAALLDEISTMTARMKHDPGEFDDPKAADEVMALIRMGKAERQDTRIDRPPFWKTWQTWFLVPVTAAATAILMMVFWQPREKQTTDEFQSRGGETKKLDAWVSLQIFKAIGHNYEQVHDVITTDDALAFAYLNRAGDNLRYLLIFGVDNIGNVFWYYPPNISIGENPSSISIMSGPQPIELPEQVKHNLHPGPLRIFGIFSSLPLSVRTIEDLLKQDLMASQTVDRMKRISLEGIGQYSLLLQVESSSKQEPDR